MNTIKSPNQVVYDYYNDISAAQLKAYVLTQLSYMFLTIYRESKHQYFSLNLDTLSNMFLDNYVMQGQAVRRQYKERAVETQNRVREILQDADRAVWVCDPDNHDFKGMFLSL